MRYVCLLATLAFGVAVPSVAQAADLFITNFQFQEEKRITVNVYDVTYAATLVNTGSPKTSVTARVTSRSSSAEPVPGQDVLHFGPVSTGGQVTSLDTFTLRVDRSVPFFFAQLNWAFEVPPSGPVANAGPPQTAPVGATVTLNGSGSTNPSGSGTLTYSWVLTAKPATSAASLTGANTVSPTFVIDKPGSYTATLTVSNGSGTSTATVTVTTINSAPVANAGPDQTVAVGSVVTLNGSGSSDVDGNPLTYAWTMLSKPTTGIGSAAVLSSATAVSPTFVADRAGTYIIQLIVNDGTVNSTPKTVTINTSNTKPVANAGANQSVNRGVTVQLNGAASTDVDGDPLTYQWSLITLPLGSTAALSSSSAVNPTFVADLSGDYVAQLIVNDGKENSNPSTVTIATNSIQAPTANAGTPQTVAVNSLVTLNGSGTDPQSLPLTYHWSLTTKPNGSTAALSSATSQSPTFTADKPGDYVAQLIVNNGTLNSAPSTVTVTTTVSAPTANAGGNQTVAAGATVNLSGSGSTDPQALALTYAFSLTSRPDGSTATLTGATTVAPAFIADKVGTYVVQLIVNNGFLSSPPVTVTITANPGAPASIVATSGTPQTTLVNTSFGAALVATVRDSQNNPVPNVPVTFTAPGSGARATFGGSATATVNTNASGVATSPVPAANGTIGSYTVAATVAGVGAAANFSLTNNSAGPSLTAISGTPQSVQLRSVYSPLSVRLLDGSGQPVPNALITFTINPNGASATFQGNNNEATTDGSGVATSQLLFSNGVIGTFTVVATAPGVTVPAVFTLTITAGAPDSITYVSGSPQSAPANTVFQNPFKVLVKDSSGNPVQGATVIFSAPNGSGPGGFFVSGNTAVTDAAGVATSNLLTANEHLGAFQVSAIVPGASGSVTFSLTNEVGLPNQITAVSGTPQTAGAGAPFSAPFTVLLKTGTNQPIVGATVTFAAPGTGASGTFAGGVNTAVTNASGQATSAIFTANGTLGSYEVTALAPGVNAAAKFLLTNVAGSPASVTVVSGSGQAAAVGAAFGAPLVALVKDGSGNPVSGVTVTFGAPAQTGASGTFATADTAVTGADGKATSNTFTANTHAGAYTVNATVSGVAAPAAFSLTNNAGAAATITATSGTPQSATINTAFGSTLGVLVKDQHGNPVPNATVEFTAPAQTGASGTFAAGAVTTNASGEAQSKVFTANSKAGAYNVTATVAGIVTPATFALTNTAGTAHALEIVAGNNQSTAIGTAFATALKVKVTDVGGNPVNNVTVTFAAPNTSGAPGATFTTTTATTGADGIATASTLTANSTFGDFTATASAAGVAAPVNFSLHNLAGPPTTLTIQGGSGQSAAIGTTFANPMVVKLTDASGNPVVGATILFAAPASGASGTFAGAATVLTVAGGIATAPAFTANNVIGGPYNVAATVVGSPAVPAANFALTNLPAPPASVTVSGGSPQTTVVASAFGQQLQVLVKDATNNPVANVTVTFTAPTGTGATGTFPGSVPVATAVTNASGIAVSPLFTANTVSGNYEVVATVAGVASPALFDMTNTAGPAASITVSTGSPQSAVVGAAFASSLVAVVKDTHGNAVGAAPVTFTAPAAGARGTFSGAQTFSMATTVQGVATANLTAGTVAGSYVVSASVPGVATTADFLMTNTPGAAASIEIVSGTPQSTPRNTAFAAPLVVIVKDSLGNPKPGAVVSFGAPASGASATFAGGVVTATTIANGTATSAALTANNIAGSYPVTAAVTGVVGTVTFALTNLPPPPASILVSGGTPQSTTVNTAFGATLRALVRDAAGDPVVGATVTFTLPPGPTATATFAGGLSTMTAQTNASGIAESTIMTANAAPGTFSAAATVAGVAGSANYSLTNNAVAGGNAIGVSSIAVGKDLQAAVTFTLPVPVPEGGMSLTVSSSDPSKLLIAGGPSWSTSPQSPIPAGTQQISLLVQSLASSGTVTVTATTTHPAYSTGMGTVTLTPSGFVLSGPNGVGNSFTTNANVTTALTVSSARLDPASLAWVEIQQIRVGGSASVNVSSTGVGSVPVGTVTIGAGESSATTNFAAGSTAGTATVTAAAPSGWSTPSGATNKVVITVNPVAVLVPNVSVGKFRQIPVQIDLNGAAPAGGLQMVVTSGDGSKMKLSKTQTGSGAADQCGENCITLPIDAGRTRSGIFYIQGLEDSGTVTYTADAGPSFGSGQGTVTLTPSGVVVKTQFGGAFLFNTFTGASPTGLVVSSVQVTNGGSSLIFQEVAAGHSLSIDMSSSAGGTVNPTSLTIPEGQISATTSFTPTAAGNTTITASVPAGSVATDQQQIVAVIATPGIGITGGAGNPAILGNNLQITGTVTLGAPAPAGGRTVTLTSSNPALLLLSNTATDAGSGSITITIAEGANSGTYYLQSRGASGDVTYTATASGYNNGNGTVSMRPSGIYLSAPIIIPGFPFPAKVGVNQTLGVFPVADNGGQYLPQAMSGGMSVTVTVASTNTAAATVTSPVTIPAGAEGAGFTFSPIAPGLGFVSLTAPSPYSSLGAAQFSVTN